MTSTSQAPAHLTASGPRHLATPAATHRWWALAALCLSVLLVGIDNTIVNVALPTIGRELSAGISDLQWVVDGYTLVFATLLLVAGHLGELAADDDVVWTIQVEAEEVDVELKPEDLDITRCRASGPAPGKITPQGTSVGRPHSSGLTKLAMRPKNRPIGATAAIHGPM